MEPDRDECLTTRPDGWGGGRLLSLWEFMLISGHDLYELGRYLGELSGFAKQNNTGAFFATEKLAVVRNNLDRGRNFCERLGLQTAVEAFDDIIRRLDREKGPMTPAATVLGWADHVKKVTLYQMRATTIYRVPMEKAGFLDNPDLFGLGVSEKYPSATLDILEAGMCYALGRNLAAVFHSMRVAEKALKVIADRLRVPRKNRSWEKIIDDIYEQLALRPDDELKATLTEATMFLDKVRGLWRNNALHLSAETFGEDRVAAIIRRIADFMTSLVEKGVWEVAEKDA